jgi:hypothetical protein
LLCQSFKFSIFLLTAPLTFLNLSFGYFTCDNFLVESGESSNVSRGRNKVGLLNF